MTGVTPESNDLFLHLPNMDICDIFTGETERYFENIADFSAMRALPESDIPIWEFTGLHSMAEETKK